jgi:threonine synthase
MSTLVDLECSECGDRFDSEQLQTFCIHCDSPLLARYDTSMPIDKPSTSSNGKGMWRWSELLPLHDLKHSITLGEGNTPLVRIPRIAEKLGLSHLLVKDESGNPTGTFKARGLAVAVSKAAELGVKNFVIPTAGNAGGALAAYAARGEFEAHIFMPEDAPILNKKEVEVAGCHLHLVQGLIDLAGEKAAQHSQEFGSFNVSTFKEPYRVEGKKIMGYELAEAFDWGLPDVIIYPTGGGTGLVGMWKAFDEMQELGWITDKRPRMVSVQSAGCAPVIRALDLGMDRVEKWENPFTIAAGLRTPGAFADRLILRAIRDSKGTGVAVSDDEILHAQGQMAREGGLLVCPEGAASLAGLKKLVDQGWIDHLEQVVLFNTGSGLKYLS